jgi:hypothetical protein
MTRARDNDVAAGITPPGPAAPPYCDYCERGRPAGVGPSYRDGCPKHDPAMRAALEEDIYETALVELAHLDDDEAFDLRWLLPHPERVPAEVDTWTTMGEFRARIREIRSER